MDAHASLLVDLVEQLKREMIYGEDARLAHRGAIKHCDRVLERAVHDGVHRVLPQRVILWLRLLCESLDAALVALQKMNNQKLSAGRHRSEILHMVSLEYCPLLVILLPVADLRRVQGGQLEQERLA